MDKKLDNIRDEIQEWLEETARSYGTIPPSKEVDWYDIEQIHHGYVPREKNIELDHAPHWDKYNICFEDAYGDAITIDHMYMEIILEDDYFHAKHLFKRYRNVVVNYTYDKKPDSIRNEIQEWLEEVTREISDIPHDKKVHWGDIEDIRDIANKRKFHWDKYDIPFDEAMTDGFDIDLRDAETLEGDFDALIYLVKKYRNIVLSEDIKSEYREEEKKEVSHV